jgi:hypothetical protein
MVPLGSLGNNLEIMFPQDYFHLEPYLCQLFPGKPRGTYFIAGISTWGLFSATNSLKIWLLQGSFGNN